MTLTQYKKYQGTITLTKSEVFFAGNIMLKSKLVEAGFSNVEVTGSGTTRTAVGIWSRPTQEVNDLPKQITEIKEL
jgi:hypothetical protein